MSDRVRNFYNDFSRSVLLRDFSVINQRQAGIKKLCDDFIRKGDSVLEIGCGVGIISRHIETKASRMLSLDISDTNVAIAKKYCRSANHDFLSVDILDRSFDLGSRGKFDAVVLLDVLEHIPAEKHRLLFEKIKGTLAPGGLAIITFPSPEYQEHLREHAPATLQVVDETVRLREVLEKTSLNLVYFTYKDIWSRNQYVYAVFQNGTSYCASPIKNGFFENVSCFVKSKIWHMKNMPFLKRIRNVVQEK